MNFISVIQNKELALSWQIMRLEYVNPNSFCWKTWINCDRRSCDQDNKCRSNFVREKSETLFASCVTDDIYIIMTSFDFSFICTGHFTHRAGLGCALIKPVFSHQDKHERQWQGKASSSKVKTLSRSSVGLLFFINELLLLTAPITEVKL